MKNKIIYIDESGISNINKYATFAFVMLEVNNKQEIEKEIKLIEENLRIKTAHWRDMSWKLRCNFAEGIKNLDYRAHVIIHKTPINVREAFLESIQHAIIKDDYTAMIIDGSKNEKIIKIIRQFLRSKNKSITTIKQKRDEAEPILRIADFVAGATRAYYDDNNLNTEKVFSLIKAKIIFTTIKF